MTDSSPPAWRSRIVLMPSCALLALLGPWPSTPSLLPGAKFSCWRMILYFEGALPRIFAVSEPR